jgi:hypothetical protein
MLKWNILPNAFGVLLLALGVTLTLVVLTVGTLRTGIWFAEMSGAWCDGSQGIQFTTSIPCWPVGTTVQAGTPYRVHLTVPGNAAWRDLQIDASPEGFDGLRMTAVGNLLMPLRRSISARWFQPMVEIRPQRGMVAVLPLEFVRADTIEPQYTGQFTAPKSGRLYIFVNDVLLPPWVPRATFFYDNNQGTATIDVEPIRQ